MPFQFLARRWGGGGEEPTTGRPAGNKEKTLTKNEIVEKPERNGQKKLRWGPVYGLKQMRAPSHERELSGGIKTLTTTYKTLLL